MNHIIPGFSFRRRARGKDIDTGEWRYGFYTRITTDKSAIGKHMIYTGEADGYEVDRNTVGMLTGMLDAYKRPIYDGDILRASSINKADDRWYIFLMVDEGATLRLYRSSQGKDPDLTNIGLLELDIIGNIYDTPELLIERRNDA